MGAGQSVVPAMGNWAVFIRYYQRIMCLSQELIILGKASYGDNLALL